MAILFLIFLFLINITEQNEQEGTDGAGLQSNRGQKNKMKFHIF